MQNFQKASKAYIAKNQKFQKPKAGKIVNLFNFDSEPSRPFSTSKQKSGQFKKSPKLRKIINHISTKKIVNFGDYSSLKLVKSPLPTSKNSDTYDTHEIEYETLSQSKEQNSNNKPQSTLDKFHWSTQTENVSIRNSVVEDFESKLKSKKRHNLDLISKKRIEVTKRNSGKRGSHNAVLNGTIKKGNFQKGKSVCDSVLSTSKKRYTCRNHQTVISSIFSKSIQARPKCGLKSRGENNNSSKQSKPPQRRQNIGGKSRSQINRSLKSKLRRKLAKTSTSRFNKRNSLHVSSGTSLLKHLLEMKTRKELDTENSGHLHCGKFKTSCGNDIA